MTVSAGTKLGAYEILASLGAGGMGEVWLAEDTRLKRKVAIKVLPTQLTGDPDRVRRFEQEAQAASALSHPNIIAIHDIGESEAGRFIVMELVSGQTLRSIIDSGNGSATIYEIGSQIARALAAAHAAGITHRDIKPDNIMVREDGYVKVLDFGLARLTNAQASGESAATMVQQTLPGTVMGTVAYMSPEQARGEAAGPPSDIFALGIVLYELATGQHPFKSETLVGYLHAITLKEPEPLTNHNPGTPLSLNDLILKMLSKDPGQRPKAVDIASELQSFQSPETKSISEAAPAITVASKDASMVVGQPGTYRSRPVGRLIGAVIAVIALLAVVGGYLGYRVLFADGKQIESIAVLPFVNTTANPEAEYLADGMTETLIRGLSSVPNLTVKPRSSVYRFKGKELSLRELGRELNVQAIVNGKVDQRGDQLTLYLELVDVAKESVIWTESYKREQSGLVTLQSEVAKDLSAKLRSRLSGADEQKVTRKYTEDNEAYQLYLKGRYHWNKRTAEDLERAATHFKAAIERDSRFALAYSGLADTYSVLQYYQNGRSNTFIDKAMPYAVRAVELDDQLAEAHSSLAFLNEASWKWAEAEREYRRALELNPNYTSALLRFARFYVRILNQDSEGLAMINRAIRIEPSSLVITDNLSQIYLSQGNANLAMVQARNAVDLDSNFSFGWFDLAYAQLHNGQVKDARSSAEKAVEVTQRSSRSLVCLGVVAAASGNRTDANEVLKELRSRYDSFKADAVEVAAVYAGLEDTTQAFAWLDRAFADRSPLLVDIRAEYPFARLIKDPRYSDLRKRMKMPE